MKRWDIINMLIDKNGYETYLEIGLQSGMCRDNINLPDENKTTIDPDERSNNPTHYMCSDDFFLQNNKTFDVIFIDGLHYGKQVLKDIKNSLSVLNKNGVVLCHDMLPITEEIQRVPRPMPEYVWTGDCWKAWAKLRGTEKDIKMYIIEADWGVGVIQKGNQKIKKQLDISFEKMNWDFFCKNSKYFNKISVDAFTEQNG